MVPRFLVNLAVAVALATPAAALTLPPCPRTDIRHACGDAIVEFCTADRGTLVFHRPSGVLWLLEFDSRADFRAARAAFKAAGRACRGRR